MENYNQHHSIEDLILGTQPIRAERRVMKMVALRGLVMFPHVSASFDIGRDKSIVAINKAVEAGDPLFFVAQKNAAVTNPAPSDICAVGTIGRIKQIIRLPGDNTRILVQGLERARILEYITSEPYFEVAVREARIAAGDEIKLEALKRKLKEYFAEFTKVDMRIPPDTVSYILNEDDPERFIYLLAHHIFTKDYEKQKFFEQSSMEKAFDMALTAVIREGEIIKVERRISGRVRKQIDKNQREYYLREQIKAIHEELGDAEDEITEYKKRAAESGMPEEVLKKIQKEIVRMSKMSPTSPEMSVSRTYIEVLTELPWTAETKDNGDLIRAAAILDEDHYGLEKVKERILEYLAVTNLTQSLKGPILCFVGPPGVGKTSIARSIARCLDRKFVSLSLGGVRDEAEIRGHRRTYIGAIPGRIISHLKLSGVRNPVFLLDEIDKMNSDFRGDPASAMLEVLDPEQNFQFRDHYLEAPFDLSRIMFITTANNAEAIPAPLLDRMELIELSGYTMHEKKEIALKYLVAKQQKAHSVEGLFTITPESIEQIIMLYTREAGVRQLEREIANICRKCARRLVESKDKKLAFEITAGNLREFLGIPKYRDIEKNENDEVGAATGLAWTAAGGVTMTIEVSLVEGGKGEIQLTGKLGDVMKESARAALSYLKSHAKQYGIDASKFEKTDIHIHVPEGATPKDGPSAGITMATALLSAFTGRQVKHGIAMTGEITLRGRVLSIGGLKEKALACHRAGIRNLIIPKDNEQNLPDIPENIRSELNIIPVADIAEVFGKALI